jgi:cobalt-zinc-cadmium efflux system protein
MAILIAYTALRHLVHPVAVHGVTLVVVSLVGVVVNVASSIILRGAERASLNVEGAFRHILTDLYAFIGTAVAGGIIAVTGFARADAIASLVVVVLMAKAGVELLGPAVRILAEAAPDDVDLVEVRRHLLELPEVIAVHDLHAWTLTSSLPVLTAHVVVTDACLEGAGSAQVLDRLQDCLATHFDVAHSTFQLEPLGHVDHELHGHN